MNNLKLDNEAIEAQIVDRGWTVIPDVYPKEMIDAAINDLEEKRELYAKIQADAGIYEETKNAYHHSALMCPSHLAFLDPNPVNGFLEHYFSGKYILNAMGVSYIEPNNGAVYTQNIHRDSRSYMDRSRLLFNTLIMLDDCTEENGATWMLEGSQMRADKPNSEEFYEKAVQATGKSGSVLLFDGNIWHAGGQNKTDKPRRVLTPLMSKPFVKQSVDYPRAFGSDFGLRASEELRQTLGYNALTPASLTQFYQPLEKRYYKSNQG